MQSALGSGDKRWRFYCEVRRQNGRCRGVFKGLSKNVVRFILRLLNEAAAPAQIVRSWTSWEEDKGVKERFSELKMRRHIGGLGVYLRSFLPSTISGRKWLTLRPGHFIPPGSNPFTHWIEGFVVPIAGLGFLEKKTVPSPAGFRDRIICKANVL